jgi:hypothetical protein
VRPLFEDACALFSPHSPAKSTLTPPTAARLLLISGTADDTVPLRVIKEVFTLYSKGPSDTDFREVEDRGHSLTIDHGCKTSVMSCCNGWHPKDSKTGGPHRCDAIFASPAVPRADQAGPACLSTDPRSGLHWLC